MTLWVCQGRVLLGLRRVEYVGGLSNADGQNPQGKPARPRWINDLLDGPEAWRDTACDVCNRRPTNGTAHGEGKMPR